MAKVTTAEKWKSVDLGTKNANDFRLEVSNLGRIRTFNKINDGRILNGSSIKGYPVIKLKLFSKRDKATQLKLDDLQAQVAKIGRKIAKMEAAKEPKRAIAEQRAKQLAVKEKVTLFSEADIKARTIHYHSLIHRIVAQYFLPKPKAAQTIVAHLDHNKENNAATNLKWMAREENTAHQQTSPNVKRERKNRKGHLNGVGTNSKLTLVKVAKLKKMLASDKYTVSSLAQQFEISDMQVIRIRRGVNWGDVPAAK
jgi:hypothetical protein